MNNKLTKLCEEVLAGDNDPNNYFLRCLRAAPILAKALKLREGQIADALRIAQLAGTSCVTVAITEALTDKLLADGRNREIDLRGHQCHHALSPARHTLASCSGAGASMRG